MPEKPSSYLFNWWYMMAFIRSRYNLQHDRTLLANSLSRCYDVQSDFFCRTEKEGKKGKSQFALITLRGWRGRERSGRFNQKTDPVPSSFFSQHIKHTSRSAPLVMKETRENNFLITFVQLSFFPPFSLLSRARTNNQITWRMFSSDSSSSGSRYFEAAVPFLPFLHNTRITRQHGGNLHRHWCFRSFDCALTHCLQPKTLSRSELSRRHKKCHLRPHHVSVKNEKHNWRTSIVFSYNFLSLSLLPSFHPI